MRAFLAFTVCAGIATPVLAKECNLFVNEGLKQACLEAAADAKKAATAAAVAKEKADKAAEAEDGGEGATPTVATAQAVPGKCWAWQCPKTSDTSASPALRLPGLSLNDKLDEPGGSAGKGASFGASTADGQTSLKSSIAAIYTFPNGSVFTGAPQVYGWNLGVGGQWTKDNSTKSKVDGRTVRLFAAGKVPTVPFLASAQLDGVEDNVSKERTVGLRFNGTFAPLWVQQGTPYSSTEKVPAYDIYASAGPHLDRVTYAKAPNSPGDAAGLNGRVDADFFPNGILWHLHVFSTFVRARDLYAQGDRPKRSATYYDFGLEWAFLPPDQKGKGLIPALSLHRTIGSNFLDGTSRSVTTTLMLTLKAAN
jgi:hypothetical protein